MMQLRQVLGLVGLCYVSAACAVETSDESLGSVQQAQQQNPSVYRVTAQESDGDISLSCPGSHPYALSGGTGAPEGGTSASMDLNRLSYLSDDGDPVGIHPVMTHEGSFTAVAMCSSYSPYKIQDVDDDGDVTLDCPSNYVPVGGGGYCTTTGARLTRNRPDPDTSGAEPTGWRATCSAGTAWVFLNCANKGGSYNWNGCKTRKQIVQSGTQGYAAASCNSGETAVAAGTYCGDGGYIRDMAVSSNETYAGVRCSEDRVTAYAVCCPNVQ